MFGYSTLLSLCTSAIQALPGSTFNTALSPLNTALEDYQPATIIAGTTVFLFALKHLHDKYQSWDTISKQSITDEVVRKLLEFKWIDQLAESQIKKEKAMISHAIDESRKDYQLLRALPDKGLTQQEILDQFKLLDKQYELSRGKLSGAVYGTPPKEIMDTMKNVWGMTCYTNPLHSHWNRIGAMKAELLTWVQDLLHAYNDAHGMPDANGIITTGGTASIIESVFAYVKKFREKHGKNRIPEMIIPSSAHPAFRKAAELLGVRAHIIPVDPITQKADVTKMGEKINKNTCLMVGSIPSYLHGVYDDMAALGKLGEKHHIGVHGDACLGGFFNVFRKPEDGERLHYDFRTQGVTSFSLDTHKYGYGPKGTSFAVFASDKRVPYLKNVTASNSKLEWDSPYLTDSTLLGSDSGSRIATLYTCMAMHGKDQYIKDTLDLLQLKDEFVSRLKQLKDKNGNLAISLPYETESTVVSIQIKGLDTSLVAQKFEKKHHWSVNYIQTKGFHFCLTKEHLYPEFIDNFCNDILDVIEEVKKNPNEKPTGTVGAYKKIENGEIPKPLLDRIAQHMTEYGNKLSHTNNFFKPGNSKVDAPIETSDLQYH